MQGIYVFNTWEDNDGSIHTSTFFMEPLERVNSIKTVGSRTRLRALQQKKQEINAFYYFFKYAFNFFSLLKIGWIRYRLITFLGTSSSYLAMLECIIKGYKQKINNINADDSFMRTRPEPHITCLEVSPLKYPTDLVIPYQTLYETFNSRLCTRKILCKTLTMVPTRNWCGT